MHGKCVARIIPAMCAFISRQSPSYTYGGRTINPRQPLSEAILANSAASAVLGEEIAATIGARSPAALVEASLSAVFSSRVKVAASLSDPGVTSPVHP